MGIIKEPAKGRVIDQATGKPIDGAIVSNNSTNQRVSTENGFFTLAGSESDQLSITYLGYEVIKVEGTKLETIYPLNRTIDNTCVKPYHEKNADGVCKFSIGQFARVNWIYILIALIVLMLLIEYHSKNSHD